MTWQEKILEKIKIIKCLKRERGSILVLTALLLPILFGCLGIAYDVGNIYIHKARLQNVTDAAALAGGRAYLQSQKKTTGTKDTYDNYTNGNITDEEYVIGGSKTRSGYHPDADNAADVYIYNNIINLGNKVYSDKFSHYALPGYKKVGEDYVNADEIFYRIGLYEQVPLYFLSVITNKNVETVRAGSVVVVVPEKTETTIIPGGGGGSYTVKNPSIFDNLYTYSEYFDPGLSNDNNQIRSTFNGNMVFTYGDGESNQENFYDIYRIIHEHTQSVDHLFTNLMTNADISDIRDNASTAKWSGVNDPVINTYFKTTDYVEAFRSKLNEPHVNAGKGLLTDENINNYSSDLYNAPIKIDGKRVYKGRKLSLPFISDNGDYYACDVDTNDYVYVRGASHIASNRVMYKQCNNMYFATVKDGNRYYLLNENYEKTNCYIENWVGKINLNGTTYDLSNDSNNTQGWFYWYNNQKIFLDENLNLLNPTGVKLLAGIKEEFNPQENRSDYYLKQTISDVFYVTKEFNNSEGNLDVNIDGPITIGDNNKPLYIIVDETIDQRVNLTVVNNERPIIFVYFGTLNVNLKLGSNKSDVSKLTVYAPYATVGYNYDNEPIHIGGTFKGNIISKRISIHAASSGTWIQENFLKNDEDIKEVDKAIEDKIKNATKPPAEIKEKIYEAYANKLGVDKTGMDDPNWYSKQSYANKQTLYHTWQELLVKYPEYKNSLWPWNEHFNIESGEDQTIITTTPEILRLINYRTEYQPEETIQENDVLDPYIYETLGQPNTY